MLGPNDNQNELFPCASNQTTDCTAPFGASEVNIIYVNPGGPKAGKGDPLKSAESIRFSRLKQNSQKISFCILEVYLVR